MKLITCIREKNSLRYLPRLIAQVRAISDLVIVLDDHSSDGSYEWLSSLSKQVDNLLIIRQPDPTFNGGRDWNILYKMAGDYKPEWIFCPDADELLEEQEAYHVRELIEASGKDVRGWSFPFYYLWNDENHYRNQGKYHNTKVIRLFRYEPSMKPPDRISHTYGTPDDIDRRLIRVAPVRMWHFGYMLAEDRKVKYNFYTDRDKDPLAAGSGGTDYNHIAEDNPTDLVEIPSLVDWQKDTPRTGDFLSQCPRRKVVGSVFPASDDLDIGDLSKLPPNSIDEIRFSFVFDAVPFSVLAPTLAEAFKVLRPGGRLDIVAVDYLTLCSEYVKAASDNVRFEMSQKFFMTPTRLQLRTPLGEILVTDVMSSAGFISWQRVPLLDFPLRMNIICYKPGDNQWH